MTARKLLRVRAVAERCDVKPRTVVRWLREGRLEGMLLNGRAWRVYADSLETFLAEQPNPKQLEGAVPRARVRKKS